MDFVVLRGIRAVGLHGVLAEEQSRAQPFEVDVSVGLDLSAAAASDDLADTIDYGALAEQVAGVITGESHRLLERVAGRVAELVLADPRVGEVVVSVRKLRPPVAVDLAHAEVTITRSR